MNFYEKNARAILKKMSHSRRLEIANGAPVTEAGCVTPILSWIELLIRHQKESKYYVPLSERSPRSAEEVEIDKSQYPQLIPNSWRK